MIESTSLSHLAKIEEGILTGSDVLISSISIDTRTLKKGDLFVAIKGEAFDGHQYINQAEKAGCSGIVAEKELVSSTPSLRVKNTVKALGALSGVNRDVFKGTVFGLTGSSGKTTTKNMLATILKEKAPTCATEGNFNNEIGVPLTLLNIAKEHRFAVIEMGARSVGDISYLGQFVKPDVAILLNAGVAHIDIFGSHENIVTAKGEIFGSLGENGIAVLNADDPAAELWAKQLQGKAVYSFALSEAAFDKPELNALNGQHLKLWAEAINCHEEFSLFTLHFNGQTQEIKLSAPGMHNVSNSLAAAAAAISVGVSLETVAKGLSKIENSGGRLNTIKVKGGLRLIDDSYNANPESMVAALKVLSLYEGDKVAVLGEMAELGELSEKLHCELAEYALTTRIDKFYLTGTFAAAMKEIIGDKAQCFKTNVLLADQLRKELVNGETVLVKGSRSSAMDEVVELIKRRVQ